MIATIVILLLLTAYGCWISYASGWMDSAHGTSKHQGTRNDPWHIMRRYGVLWPSLIVPFVTVLACALAPVHWWAALGIVPVGLTSRFWFRVGVLKNGKYQEWYGKPFTVMGALWG